MSKQDALEFIGEISRNKGMQDQAILASNKAGFAGLADLAMKHGKYFTLNELASAGKEFMKGRANTEHQMTANLLHKNIAAAADGDISTSGTCQTISSSACTTFGSSSSCS